MDEVGRILRRHNSLYRDCEKLKGQDFEQVEALSIEIKENFGTISIIENGDDVLIVGLLINVGSRAAPQKGTKRIKKLKKEQMRLFVPAHSALWGPLKFPLLFPTGGGGRERGGAHGVAFIQYTRKCLVQEQRLRNFYDLSNQYILDTYSRWHSSRLNYNLWRLREYEDVSKAGTAGFRRNIDSDFPGSKRWPRSKHLDTLSTVGKLAILQRGLSQSLATPKILVYGPA